MKRGEECNKMVECINNNNMEIERNNTHLKWVDLLQFALQHTKFALAQSLND